MEQRIDVGRLETIEEIFGKMDENIRLIEKEYQVTVVYRDGEIRLSGEAEAVYYADHAVKCLIALVEKGEPITEQTMRYVIALVAEGREGELTALSEDCICVSAKGRPIKPKTLGQQSYVKAIAEHTITFGVGPAGTGKTYLAVALAVKAFRAHEINKIILTRPAVEAGEKLGFLPGDLQNKVDPYLRPLYDALFDMLGAENYQKYLERGNIEVAPLAYMRGRTLDDSFIILDEAQNTTPEQMKMFLTRLGANSKAVITGDITQIDLPDKGKSGLVQATRILKKIEDIAIIRFTEKDVVRHHLVQEIIRAYETFYQEQQNRSAAHPGDGGHERGDSKKWKK